MIDADGVWVDGRTVTNFAAAAAVATARLVVHQADLDFLNNGIAYGYTGGGVGQHVEIEGFGLRFGTGIGTTTSPEKLQVKILRNDTGIAHTTTSTLGSVATSNAVLAFDGLLDLTGDTDSIALAADFNIRSIRVIESRNSLQARTSQMTEKINVYSFALKPEEHQPSGTCNFSRIDNAQLKITGTPHSGTFSVYAVNYNVLRIMSGMGGLAYSN